MADHRRRGGQHLHLTSAAEQHGGEREGQRHRQREAVAGQRALGRRGVEVARDHDAAAHQRHRHREPGARGHPLAHPEPAQQAGHERAQALDDEHVRHRGAVEGHDEAGGGGREADRHADPGGADAREHRRGAAPLAQGGDREQERGAEDPAPEHGGPRIRVRAAREQAAQAPEHGGGGHQQPAAPPVARAFRRWPDHRARPARLVSAFQPAWSTAAPSTRSNAAAVTRTG